MTNTTTTIYLSGTTAYRREHDFVTHCKKSEVASLVENRKAFDVIVGKNNARKYDRVFQGAGFYMAEVNDYNYDEYIIHYEHI